MKKAEAQSRFLQAQAAEHLVYHCGDLKANERVLIVSNPETQAIGNLLESQARKLASKVIHSSIAPAPIHGQEPPAEVANLMSESELIFGITSMSMAHTKARLHASEKGARYLSLPQYSSAVLESQALLTDFRNLTSIAHQLSALLSRAQKARVTTALGTDLEMSLTGRSGNSAPGWCYENGVLASPPDAEVNIAVVENHTRGKIVVDGSIPCRELGLLSSPVTLYVEEGRVHQIEGQQAQLLNQIFDRLQNPKTRVIAEFGIGLNPKAKLCGEMLEDEGCLGTVHFGIGSNATIGGQNSVPFHLDHIIRSASICIDDRWIMQDGKILDQAEVLREFH